MSNVNDLHFPNLRRLRAKADQPLDARHLTQALLRIRLLEAIPGLSHSTIYGKLKASEFVEPVRLGTRCTRFRAGDMQAWLAAQSR
jgi:predicted DNA-binding transcriptional regulator AlpA